MDLAETLRFHIAKKHMEKVGKTWKEPLDHGKNHDFREIFPPIHDNPCLQIDFQVMMRRWLSAVAAVEPQVWGQLLQIGDLEAVQEAPTQGMHGNRTSYDIIYDIIKLG